MTAPAINEIILPHLYLTQFFTDWFALVIGKLDTTGGDANELAHGRGDDKFMNLAFSFNPVVITLAPHVGNESFVSAPQRCGLQFCRR